MFGGAPFGALIDAGHEKCVVDRIVGAAVEFDPSVPAWTRVVLALDSWLAILIKLITHWRLADEIAVFCVESPEVAGFVPGRCEFHPLAVHRSSEKDWRHGR